MERSRASREDRNSLQILEARPPGSVYPWVSSLIKAVLLAWNTPLSAWTGFS